MTFSYEQSESQNSITSDRTVMTKPIQISDSLFHDLRSLIIEARQDVARSVNSALVMLYWRISLHISYYLSVSVTGNEEFLMGIAQPFLLEKTHCRIKI